MLKIFSQIFCLFIEKDRLKRSIVIFYDDALFFGVDRY